jgi:urease gamma subunit
MAGRETARGFVNEAAQSESQAKGTDLQAIQSSERRREDLRAQLSAITAQRAARGLSLDTPTAVAIEREINRQSVRDEGVERLGFMNQSSALRRQAAVKRKNAKGAITASYLSAAGSLMSAAGDIGAAFGGGGGVNPSAQGSKRMIK